MRTVRYLPFRREGGVLVSASGVMLFYFGTMLFRVGMMWIFIGLMWICAGMVWYCAVMILSGSGTMRVWAGKYEKRDNFIIKGMSKVFLF